MAVGEKWLRYVSGEGHYLAWPFIAGDVKKTLKAVRTICDARSYVLFKRWTVCIVSGTSHEFTELIRKGNVYMIDVLVRARSKSDDVVASTEADFARHVAAP